MNAPVTFKHEGCGKHHSAATSNRACRYDEKAVLPSTQSASIRVHLWFTSYCFPIIDARFARKCDSGGPRASFVFRRR